MDDSIVQLFLEPLMLIAPTNPLFFETIVRFVTTFVPTLTIHRVHIGERTADLLSLQIEMTDGSMMFVEAQYWLDQIQLVLEYGWQRVDVWMYANFRTNHGGANSNAPVTLTVQPTIHSQPTAEDVLESDGLNKIPMNRVLPKDIDKYSLELR